MKNVFVLGSGGFGTAISVALAKHGQRVSLWGWQPEFQQELREKRENVLLLKGVPIPESVEIVDTVEGVETADFVIIATPTVGVRGALERVAGRLSPDCALITVAKGLEPGTLLRLSEVAAAVCPGTPEVALSGPSHAEEVSRGVPTAVVAASRDQAAALRVQELFDGSNVRVYLSDDVTGVELGGALKNIIALAAGILDGIGLGDNAKAALMTRGLTEIARLGLAMGARHDTFSGLSGVGDLIVTCTSMHSRNRRAGILIGKGRSAEEAIAEVGMVVEGIIAARCARELAAKAGVELPITEQVCRVLDGEVTPRDALRLLMARPLRSERETLL